MTNSGPAEIKESETIQAEGKPASITIALAGNPNSGKTTIFNNLTGANQKVGNYGGVTVETTEGSFQYGDVRVKVVDLPGTYSLTAYSIEEVVARNFIIEQRPDVVLDVVDGSNLERNLYLAAQLKEMGIPLVIALNMTDEMKKKSMEVDLELLSQYLGAPIIRTVGVRNKGIKKLKRRTIEFATGKREKPPDYPIHYGVEIEEELEKITKCISSQQPKSSEESKKRLCGPCHIVSPKWTALKLLENDPEILSCLKDCMGCVQVPDQVEVSRKRLQEIFGDDPETIIAEQRYGYVHGIVRAVIRQSGQARIDFTDKIDKVLTNRLLGLPIFGLLMYLAFWLVFMVGEVPMGWIESAIGHLTGLIAGHWPADVAPLVRSLLLDGIIAGVGGVLVFVPNIMLLFLAISLLEDTGYMARAAFIMDRLMKWVGLHGKSFIPMLTGFGCSVPGIMATRILDNRRDRFTTLLVLPLMSCGARLPIYMLIIPAFFAPGHRATVMYAIYIIGILVAIFCARLLRSTLFRGEPSPFVMELPPYRIPTSKAVCLHVWQRTRL
ncbi:MAG: ferrous iron transport protein B, partial [Sedimentisphaerales bacterium]|nr:ferrous iron transport protein B [Sedimentisphaerales bacterium]